MEEETCVLEVRKTFIRKEEKSVQKIIFEKKEDGHWEYLAPNAQSHTVEELELILAELKKLS